MADYKVTDAELTSIANAIRTKGGTQAQLEFPTGFVSAVQAIPTGSGVIQPLSVTQNGIYNPPSGVDGYSPVTVNVSGGSSGDYELLQYIDSNGTQGIDLGIKFPANTPFAIVYSILQGSVAYNWVFGCEYTANSFTGVQINSISPTVAMPYIWAGSSAGVSWDTTYLGRITTAGRTTVNSVSQSNVWAFALGRRSGDGYSSMSCSRFYLLGIGDYIYYPFRRKSDNVCGLWDAYNQQFLTDSLGGDPFVAGPVIGTI